MNFSALVSRFRTKPVQGLNFIGSSKARARQTGGRIVIVMTSMMLIYGVIGVKLLSLGFVDGSKISAANRKGKPASWARPDLVDRNGEILAMNLKMASLFAEPRRIVDADEAIELLSTVLPDLNFETTYKKLTSGAGFVWLKRELTPRQQGKILALGVPGIGFRDESRRFYPGGPTASHVVGLVNIDNKGIAGIEKYMDDAGLTEPLEQANSDKDQPKPVRLTLDLRVQNILRDELGKALVRYKAIAAAGVILNVDTGEIAALASLPDYDPNNPVDALKKDRFNRISAGSFEMGSTFKAFTVAMGLDTGRVKFSDKFDARKPIRIGGFTINDFHGKRRLLSVSEVFIYSSNIGAAGMAEKVGIAGHREFLTRLGLLTKLEGFELPEIASPKQPKVWKKVNSITISYGHGVSTTPLQTAVAAAALMNGGKLIPPTFFPRSKQQALAMSQQVLSPDTSAKMRYLMRLNVLKGSGRRANIPGYMIGGKTGTADKVINGRYSSKKRFNAFLSAFPVNKPKYIVLVILDEPVPEEGQTYATAGTNAAPTVGRIVKRAAPLLGVMPQFNIGQPARLSSY